MEISFSNGIRVADNVLIRELEGEFVLLNLNSESHFGLDEVASRMWSVLTSNETIALSCEILAMEHDVPESDLRKDIKRLINELVEHGLVEIEAR